jgi:NAD(P)-dependent dehydrogenase (short-subunit alcohol dehydrogenase family)
MVHAKDRIRANIIHPGPVDTPMQKEWHEETKKAMSDYVPIGRLGQPEDIAFCALFLASDESSYITGQEIVVDGGIRMSILLGVADLKGCYRHDRR